MKHHLRIFNVQHGACALHTVVTDSGVRWDVMLDCGHMNNDRGKWFPGDYLKSQGVLTLDLLIVTNLDEDHVSGLPNLLQSGIPIRNIFSNPTVKPQDIKKLKKQHGMGAGIEALVAELAQRGVATSIPYIPGIDIECFWNPYPFAFEDENNLSCVTSLMFDGHRFLFCGDMECEGFDHLLTTNARIRQVVPAVEMFVAPHHGRANGICPALFDVYSCKPKLVIISDDYMQYDTQETSAYYRAKATGHPFKSEGNTRWVLTTRSDGTLDFMPIGSDIFVF